jgi:hypothetical protein
MTYKSHFYILSLFSPKENDVCLLGPAAYLFCCDDDDDDDDDDDEEVEEVPYTDISSSR